MIERGSDDFAWTALGQLRQAAISGETARDYTYDAFGRRVKTVVGSQTNRFLYDGWHMIGEYDSTAGHWLWQEGPWCEGERMLEHVARDTNDLDTDSNVTEYRTYAVHEDFQDTVWGLSDTGAAVVERFFYTDPYGASETKNAAGTNIGAFATNVFHRKRLHGGFIEAVSGLYDFRNRWLCLQSFYWTARDPLLPERGNLYQYLAQSPLDHRDPFGLLECCQSAKKCKNEPCAPGSSPCKKELDEYRKAACDAFFSNTADLVYKALCLGLSRTTMGGQCDKSDKCAKTGAALDRTSYQITICHHWVKRTRWVPDENGYDPHPVVDYDCVPCCDGCDCKCLIDHEAAHVGCLESGLPPEDCGHYGGTTPQYNDCAKILGDCVRTPTDGCTTAAIQCFKSL